MIQYLDIKSYISSRGYLGDERIFWAVNQSEYDFLSVDLYKWLLQSPLPSEDYEIFQISFPLIHLTLACYLSHLLDYKKSKRANIKSIYSKESIFFIDPIHKNHILNKIFYLDIIEKRFKFSLLKKGYSLFVKFLPGKFISEYIGSQNQLIRQYILGRNPVYIFPNYYFRRNKKSIEYNNSISNTLTEYICNNIKSKYFELDDFQKESISFIFKSFINRTQQDLYTYNNFLKSKKVLITATGTDYYNRLLSFLASSNELKVVRVDHGGERIFYLDDCYWDYESYYLNAYITYGQGYKNELQKRFSSDIQILNLGSEYYKDIFITNFSKKKESGNKRILYVSNSFVYEARQLLYSKIIDPVLFDWQLYLIKILKKNGYYVNYKKHPKGFLQEENILGGFCDKEITLPMINALQDIDICIFETAGTAFVESLCARKDIILIDIGQRRFNQRIFNDLIKCVKIVKAYWKNNLIYINEKELIDAIESPPKNKDDIGEIVYKYYLSSESNDIAFGEIL